MSIPHRTEPHPDARRPANAELLDRLEAAIERLLDDQTYAEIPIDALVREAGMAKSTFYVYFEDKDDLLRELAQETMSSLVGFDATWWNLTVGASKLEIRAALAAMTHAYRSKARIMRSIVEATLYDPRMSDRFAVIVGDAIESAAEWLGRGQDAGVVPADVDAEATAFAQLWTMERGLYRDLLHDVPAAELALRIDVLTEFIWASSRGES